MRKYIANGKEFVGFNTEIKTSQYIAIAYTEDSYELWAVDGFHKLFVERIQQMYYHLGMNVPEIEILNKVAVQ